MTRYQAARLRSAVCLLTLLAADISQASDLKLDLDPSKTKIAFVVGDVLHTVRGTFQVKQGHLSLDQARHAIAGVVVVDAASGNSGSGLRDKRMTRDILEAQRYPEIRFTPVALSGNVATSASSDVEVNGSLLIHGQAHQITIHMRVRVIDGEVSATGKFVVPYVEWGMKNPSTFLLKVSDKVEIEVTAAGHLQQ